MTVPPPTPLSPEQISDAREAFNLFDRNSEGAIEAALLGMVGRSLGYIMTEAQLADFISKADPHKSGKIEFNSLLTVLPEIIACSEGPKEGWEKAMKGLFSSLAKIAGHPSSSELPAAALKHALTSVRDRLSAEEADDLLKMCVTEGDEGRVVRFEDFCAALGVKNA